MTYDDLILRLDEIGDQFCPTTPEQKAAEMEQGQYSVCGCAICQLQQDLIVSEVVNGAGITTAPALAAENARLKAALKVVSAKIDDDMLDIAGPHGLIHVPMSRPEIDAIRALAGGE